MIPIRILNGILGYCRISSEIKNTEALLNMFMRHSIINWKFRKGEKRTQFFILESDLHRFASLCAANCIEYREERRYGLYPYLRKYKRRFGIPIGVVLFISILWVSGLFIWDINVTGNSNVREEDIIERLNSLGCGIGSYIPSLKFDSIYNRVLVQSDDLSWISINMRGTVANIEVREIAKPGNPKPNADGANLTAAADGQIELLEIYAGAPAVNVGDSVRAGDLLVSGIIEGKKMGNRYVYARGKVYARLTKEIVVEVPLTEERVVYTGREIRDTTVKIFGKSINISSNSGNIEGLYDKIEKKEQLSFFGVVSVPVYVATTVYKEYKFEDYTLSETEAVREAYNRLKTETGKALRDAELLKRTISAEFRENSYVIKCSLYCIEDIASTVEFEISD